MNPHTPRHARLLGIAATALALTACGGGGGDAAPTPTPTPTPTPSFTVGGTLTVVQNLAVDSDTNDPTQTPRVRNGTLNTAQPISASAQVLGTVNLPSRGPTGPNFAGGDVFDYYRVSVAAGQTVELDFSADPAINDLDLYVYDAAGNIVGGSFDVNRAECVRITTAGEYRIEVEAFDGASLYNLRVTAPGASATCANATTADREERITAGELIVGLHDGSARAAKSASAMSDGRLRVLRGRVAAGRHALLGLPDDAATRRRALAALPGGRADAQPAAAGLDARAQQHKDTIAYAKRLRAAGSFDYVMLNRTVRTAALVGSFPPNDPRYPLQRWHYDQISMPAAMQLLVNRTPQPTVRPIVAVVDTGIVADHPDLAPQLVPGFDFILDPASADDGNGIDNNPDDLRSGATQPSFHGSHVAGTVAAATFEGQGAAGVAPMAQIMPLRALGVRGSGSFYDIIQSISFAAGLANDSNTLPARRADVINLSLGAAGQACEADAATFFGRVRAQGSIVVAATGNDANRPGATAPVGFPANCAGVIAVSATDPKRQVSYYSNTGAQVAIAAPGGDMRFSTTGTGIADGVVSTVATFSDTGTRVPTFAPLQGTSMATPHVAGVMALMRWVHPNITPAEVETLLAQGALTDEAGAPGRDVDFGWGIVNAAKAVQAAITLRDGGAPPVTGGVVEAAPSALDFGSAATALEFTLRTTGATTEVVNTVASSNAAITVTPVSIDGASKLGSYRVAVDRAALPNGVTTATVTATTSTARTLTVQITVEKLAGGPAASDAGPVYVLVINAANNEVVAQADVQASGGRYVWSTPGIGVTRIVVVAGTDYDNDGFICARGEACGAFPVLGVNITPITLDRNRNDLDFLLAPVGAGNAQSAGGVMKVDVSNRLPKPADASSGSTLNLPWSMRAR